MKTFLQPLKQEQGSVLILCILMLFLLTVLGISSTTTSDLELSIASNENYFHMAFFQADGGVEAGKEVIEKSVLDRTWSDTSPLPVTMDQVQIWDLNFWLTDELTDSDIPSDANRQVVIPVTVAGRALKTNLLFGETTQYAEGAAIQMVEGYASPGHSAASGGSWKTYGIRSRHEGIRNSSAMVRAGWRHVN